jgi:hypothetical protein
MRLFLAVLKIRTVVALQEPVFAAEVSTAETAVADDWWDLLLALVRCGFLIVACGFLSATSKW